MSTFLTYDSSRQHLKFDLPQSHTMGWGNASDPNVALGHIANDLPNITDGVASGFKSEDLSMPSPWAKFISFETLLYDRDNTYGAAHLQAVADWRSLLTIIALREILGLSINLNGRMWSNTVNLASDGNPFTKRFYNNVTQLYPKNSLFSLSTAPSDPLPKEWDNFVPILIKGNTEIIGFLSNSTLVCPPYSYSATARANLTNIGFFSADHFINPISLINADPVKAFTMKSYLNLLYNNMTDLMRVTTKPINIQMCNDMANLINEFRNEITMISQVAHPMPNVSDLGGSLTTVTDLLSKVNVSQPIPESDVILQSQKNSKRKLYVVGNTMSGDTNVISNQKLIHIDPFFISGTGPFGSHPVDPNKEVIYRDTDLLLNDLYLISSDGSIINQGAEEGRHARLSSHDVIWPINEILFEFMTVDEIRENIDITYDGGETYTVTLKISLARQEHVFEKKYTGNNVKTQTETAFPYISIWPYVKVTLPGSNDNIWKNYSVFRTVSKNSFITEILCDTPAESDTYSLERVSSRDLGSSEFISLKDIPTHIKLYDKNGNMQNYCGAILLSEPAERNVNPNSDCTVSFDFGTTSSTAYYKIGTGGERFPIFGTQFWNKHNANGKNEMKEGEPQDSGLFVAVKPLHLPNHGKNYFMPDTYLKRFSYASIYEVLSTNVPDAAITTFTHGHIPFDYAADPSRGNVITEVYNNLKWSEKNEVKGATKRYLYQFLLQVLYSLTRDQIGSANFKFSYPTALSKILLSGYKNNINSILRELEQSTGIKLSLDMERAFYSESIVSAKHFQIKHQTGTIACVDIGGGTTDISIWKHKNGPVNLLQTSVKLASRDIFLTSFWKFLKNDNLLRKSILDLNKTVQDYVVSRGLELSLEELPKIESILFEFEEAVFALGGHVENQHNRIQFEKTVSIGFFALMYYLMDAIVMIKDRLENDRSITICIGGNGAKLIDWLPAGYLSDIEKTLNSYLKSEHGMDISLSINYTKEALKTEAVRGLLLITESSSEFDANLKLPASEKLILCKRDGTEEVIESNVDVLARADIQSYFDNNGKPSAEPDPSFTEIDYININPELDSIKLFLKYFNELNSIFGDKEYLVNYSQADYARICEKMQFSLDDAVTSGRLDPAFIFGIQSILKRENG